MVILIILLICLLVANFPRFKEGENINNDFSQKIKFYQI
jgi:hypothetical protein